MCLKPISIVNPYYDPKGHTKSLEYNLPKYIQVPCGRCLDCCKQKASDWRFRVIHEVNSYPQSRCKFITLTLSDEYWDKSVEPGVYLRLFFDRIRKYCGHSIKHFFVHEYGEKKYSTHRLHFHGILFGCNLSASELLKLWHYGIIHVGDRCDASSASYIVKYISKGYTMHHMLPSYWIFPPRVYASAGVGACAFEWITRSLVKSGMRIAIGSVHHRIPRYYKEKLLNIYDKMLTTLKNSLVDVVNGYKLNGHYYSDVYDYVKSKYYDLRNKIALNPYCLGKDRVRENAMIEYNFKNNLNNYVNYEFA